MQYISHEIKISVYQPNDIPSEFIPLIDEAKKQTQKSYAPYSAFHVGAALLLENGIIVGGNNQENSAYPSGTCAERTAIFYANSQYPDIPVKLLAIAAFTNDKFTTEPVTPCGACRQVLLETENRYDQAIKVILYGTDKIYVFDSIKQLLPLSFGKDSLTL
ncbi:MAG: cytidine deaminase [Bacteroidetes bacterium]|nr:cytidine deaminase [Bacteroidota bacterium]